MWAFRSLVGLIGKRISIIRKLSLFAFKNFLFESVFVGLSCMKTVIDSVSFLVAEGTYHSRTESRFSAERWGRGNWVSAVGMEVVPFVAVGVALSVLMRMRRCTAVVVVAALIIGVALEWHVAAGLVRAKFALCRSAKSRISFVHLK